MLPRLIYGYQATQSLYVVCKLGIADYLSSGSKTIAELANLANVNTEPLFRVMRCLVTLDVFNQNEDKYSLNENSEQLRSDTENSFKDFIIFCGEELYQSSGKMLFTVETGKPAFDAVYGKSFWDYLDSHPKKAELFHTAMERGSTSTIKKVLEHYDFSSFKNIVDVGGGKGHFVCTILQAYPNANGITFDLPNAKDCALAYIQQVNLQNRCIYIPGSFFNSVPAGDLYLLKVILHDWDDENSLNILINCRKAILPNGKLLIIEKVLDKSEFQDLACYGDLNMMVSLNGKERSIDEFKELLFQANFAFVKVIDTGTQFKIIEAKPQ